MGRGELSQCLGSGLVGAGHEVLLEAADQSCLSGGNGGCLVTTDADECGGGVSEPPGADLDREIDQVAMQVGVHAASDQVSKPSMNGFPPMFSDATLPVSASLASLQALFAPLFTAPSFRTFTMLACGVLNRAGAVS